MLSVTPAPARLLRNRDYSQIVLGAVGLESRSLSSKVDTITPPIPRADYLLSVRKGATYQSVSKKSRYRLRSLPLGYNRLSH